MMNPTNDYQTSTQSISRALCNLDNDLRQILILHNGNGNTPGLSFEALTDHWQNPHQIGPAIEHIFKKLMDAFQIDPASNWDSEVGLELRKHLLDLEVDQDLGWVNVEDLALLSESLAGEPISPSVDDAEKSNPASNFLPKQLELPF